MELSENLKLRLDIPSPEGQHDRLSRTSENTPSLEADLQDEAESQMRRALGLLGESSRHRSQDHERTEQQPRPMDRFGGGGGGGGGGGLHRRRFVQDGDIPVTVLRREPGHDVPANRTAAAQSAPTTNRLQRAEAALAAETAAREKADRMLGEAHAVVRDLQTKIGHAELAKNEAVEALRRERDGLAQIKADLESREAALRELRELLDEAESSTASLREDLSGERHARRVAEKALRHADAAREAAEQMVRTLVEEAANTPVAVPEPAPFSARSKRTVAAEPVVAKHAEPVVAKHAEPVVAKPAEPVVAKHAEPVVAKHAEPVVAKHAEPVVAKHAEPVVAKRVEPIVAKRADPVAAKPAEPVVIKAIEPARRGRRPADSVPTSASKVRGKAVARVTAVEPEPVKWWLIEKPSAKRR